MPRTEAARSGAEVASAAADPLDELSQALRTSLTIITLQSCNLDQLYERLDESKRRQLVSDLRRQTRVLTPLVLSALDLLQANTLPYSATMQSCCPE